MSAEEFEAFKKRVESDTDLASAPARIFRAAVAARTPTLKKRWPPGFPVHGVHMHGTRDFDFRGTRGDVSWKSASPSEDTRLFFDAANNDAVEQPARWTTRRPSAGCGRTKKGTCGSTRQARRLTAVRGAKLATLAETDWYAIDRISPATLRERLAESPVESFTLPELPGAGSPDPWAVENVLRALAELGLRGLPTLVLETAEGKIVLLRVERYDGDSVQLLCRTRPLAPYPPFHTGDDPVEVPRPDARKPNDSALKDAGATSPAAGAK